MVRASSGHALCFTLCHDLLNFKFMLRHDYIWHINRQLSTFNWKNNFIMTLKREVEQRQRDLNLIWKKSSKYANLKRNENAKKKKIPRESIRFAYFSSIRLLLSLYFSFRIECVKLFICVWFYCAINSTTVWQSENGSRVSIPLYCMYFIFTFIHIFFLLLFFVITNVVWYKHHVYTHARTHTHWTMYI